MEGLDVGDALSITGRFDAELYEPPGGAVRISLSIIADKVLVLKKPTKEKKPAPENPAAKPSSPPSRRDAFDEDLPF